MKTDIPFLGFCLAISFYLAWLFLSLLARLNIGLLELALKTVMGG